MVTLKKSSFRNLVMDLTAKLVKRVILNLKKRPDLLRNLLIVLKM